MKIKLAEYVIDSHDKDGIKKIVAKNVNKSIWVEYIDTKDGGYDNDGMQLIDTGIYRKEVFEISYSTINTPYGKYTDFEKTVYDKATELHEHFTKKEIDLGKRDLIVDSRETLSELEEDEDEPIQEEKYGKYAEKTKEVLKEFDIEYSDFSSKELDEIYTGCLHEFFMHPTNGRNFDVDRARYELIDKQKMQETIEKVEYMNSEFIELRNKEINKSKERFENI